MKKAVDDYVYCFNALFPFVDYFVVNVSSPNTPNLRELQDKKPLTEIKHPTKTQSSYPKPKPILLKNLTNEQLLDIIDIVKTTHTAGVIATTTLERKDYNLT